MKMKSMLILVVGVLIGLGLQGVLAKGDARVTITGGDLPHDIEVTDDACLMNALQVPNLADYMQPVANPPDNLGTGYLVTHYDQLNNGDYQPFDELRFYFDPRGGYGYVHYLGIVDRESEDAWYRPTRQSQFVIEYLLTQARANP